MKRVYTADDVIFVGYIKSVLAEQGIDCVLRNEYLSGGLGELPPIECWPEIWVLDDADEVRAKTIIQSITNEQ